MPDPGLVEAPATPASAGQHLVLIDGSGFIFRAFHALPPMSRPDGTPVNAVFGFTNMLARLLQNHEGSHIAVVFDAGRTTFRNELYTDYKAHRPEPPDELIPQFALVRDATAAFGVKSIELANWEADDLIASYATAASRAGFRTTIVSSDKDLMQLIDERVAMLDPIKQKPIGADEVLAKFGVPPGKVAEVQALMGDAVDNVPGVPGVGPKNAAQLIQEFGDVEGVIAGITSMKPSKRRDLLLEHRENIRISRKLVELCRECPLPFPLEELAVRPPDNPTLTRWLVAMGFRSTATRLGLFAAAAEPSPDPEQLEAPPEQPPFGPYPTVTTLDQLGGWVAAARSAGMVGLDVQTDGRDPNRATLLGISLALGPNKACYVPLRHVLAEGAAQATLDGGAGAPALEQIEAEAALAALGPLLADPAVLKVMHNGKPDLVVLGRAGIEVTPVDDTMLISYALGAGAHGHGLEEAALRDLGHKATAQDSVTGTGRARLAFAQVPLDLATAFAAEDPDIALRLWHVLRPRLRTGKALRLYERIERRLMPVLIDMERAGIRVDAEDLRRMSADFAERMAAKEAEIVALAGHPFNLGSPKALGEVLFDEMKLPGGRRMATGAWGTDVSVLQALADQGHELPAKVIDWRQLSKLRSTYTEALQEEINPATGRVHTSFGQAHTSTGRISSTEPNLQNIPIRTEEGSRIRRAFIAGPGQVLVSADYSQIELRLMAHVADIGPLKEAFATGQDIHARTASEVFGVPMAGMDRSTRNRAKAINFGIIYGISGFGLARQLGIEQSEAALYIRAYFERYPGIRDYMERTKEEARIHGYVLTPFGRRCWVPGIREKVPAKRAYAERQAINAPLQGGAADVIKHAMVRLPAALRRAGLSARLLLQVHDELLFEASEAEAEQTEAVAKSVMEAAADLSVPLVVETGAGHSWAEAH